MNASDAAAWWGAVVATIAVLIEVVRSKRDRPSLSVVQHHWGGWSCGLLITSSNAAVVTGFRAIGYRTLLKRITGKYDVLESPEVHQLESTERPELPIRLEPHTPVKVALRYVATDPDRECWNYRFCYIEIYEAFHSRPYRFVFKDTESAQHVLKG